MNIERLDFHFGAVLEINNIHPATELHTYGSE
jgi:hypothetical protein